MVWHLRVRNGTREQADRQHASEQGIRQSEQVVLK